MVSQMSLQLLPNGLFRGQSTTPLGIMVVEGQWQIAPTNQLSLQGQQSLAWQVMPYLVVIQFVQTAPQGMTGITVGGEQTVWQRVG